MIENFMWMPCPYVRYVFCQISGILVASYAGTQAWFEVLFATGTVLFAAMFVFRKWLGPAFRNLFFGCLGFMITFWALAPLGLYKTIKAITQTTSYKKLTP